MSCRPDPRKPSKLSFFVDATPTEKTRRTRRGQDDNDNNGGHNFHTDPWSRHMVQVEGDAVRALVAVCTPGGTEQQAFLMMVPARGFGRGGVPARTRDLNTRVRSLGPAGPFLQQYGKAAELLRGEGNRLLEAVAFPGRLSIGRDPEGGTFVPANACTMDTSRVSLNAAQRDAVLQLSGGLDIIVGPPGLEGFIVLSPLQIARHVFVHLIYWYSSTQCRSVFVCRACSLKPHTICSRQPEPEGCPQLQ